MGVITYEAEKADVDNDAPDAEARAKYEASIEDGTSTLTIEWEAAIGAITHAEVFTVEISASDEADTTVTSIVMVQRNTAPVATDTAIPDLRLGTQDAERPTANQDWPEDPYACETLNECKLTFPTTGTRYFDDAGMLMYSAVSESSNVSLSPVDGGIMIVGRTPTVDDGANGDDQQITVTVTAEDKGGLTVEKTFKVNVDAAPEAGDFTLPAQTITAPKMIDLKPFFSDPEDPDGSELTFAAEVDTNPHITATTSGDNLDLGLAANGIEGGPVAVKITATEPGNGDDGVGQSHEITVMVTRGS